MAKRKPKPKPRRERGSGSVSWVEARQRWRAVFGTRSKYTRTRGEAESWIESQGALGSDPAAPSTLREALIAYTLDRTHPRATTSRREEWATSHINVHLGDLPLDSVKTSHIAALDKALRATLGYLPQDFGVYPRVSAADMLDHLAVLKGVAGRGERRDTVESLLRQVNLWDVRKKAIAGFSGGMRQRFGIAQALIGNPRLIIVDEPTAGLDKAGVARLVKVVEEEVARGAGVAVVSHEPEIFRDLAKARIVLERGRVIEGGLGKG